MCPRLFLSFRLSFTVIPISFLVRRTASLTKIFMCVPQRFKNQIPDSLARNCFWSGIVLTLSWLLSSTKAKVSLFSVCLFFLRKTTLTSEKRWSMLSSTHNYPWEKSCVPRLGLLVWSLHEIMRSDMHRNVSLLGSTVSQKQTARIFKVFLGISLAGIDSWSWIEGNLELRQLRP